MPAPKKIEPKENEAVEPSELDQANETIKHLKAKISEQEKQALIAKHKRHQETLDAVKSSIALGIKSTVVSNAYYKSLLEDSAELALIQHGGPFAYTVELNVKPSE